jgi:hypothetical protein
MSTTGFKVIGLLGVLALAATAGIPKAPPLDFAAMFRAYPVAEVYAGTPAPFDFKRNKDYRDYKTRINAGLKEGANFAGHYTVIRWGCGTECAVGLIVDTETGEYGASFQSCGSEGYRPDSSLFIINTEQNDPFLPEACKPQYFLWDGHALNRISKPRPPVRAAEGKP